MEKEYWRWPESKWTSPDIDWKTGDIISAGVDVGSVSSQAVVLVDGKLFCYTNFRTGSDSPESAQNVMDKALEEISAGKGKLYDTNVVDACVKALSKGQFDFL